MKNAPLRQLLAEISRQVHDVEKMREGAIAAETVTALVTSWASLVRLLDVGPEPEVRQCPFCTETIMRAATRCMHCWGKSVALDRA
jgi:hypothetical protein